MKSERTIRDRIALLESIKTEAIEKHSNLDQISMLSGEGSELRALINDTKGQIDALKWVLNEH